jgi:predicted DNA-binding protein
MKDKEAQKLLQSIDKRLKVLEEYIGKPNPGVREFIEKSLKEEGDYSGGY